MGFSSSFQQNCAALALLDRLRQTVKVVRFERDGRKARRSIVAADLAEPEHLRVERVATGGFEHREHFSCRLLNEEGQSNGKLPLFGAALLLIFSAMNGFFHRFSCGAGKRFLSTLIPRHDTRVNRSRVTPTRNPVEWVG